MTTTEEKGPRYRVDVKTAQAPSKYWGAARVIRVLDTSVGPTDWHWVRKGTVAQWGDAHAGRWSRHLDGNYTGPRSAFGNALREAKELAERLNREEETR